MSIAFFSSVELELGRHLVLSSNVLFKWDRGGFFFSFTGVRFELDIYSNIGNDLDFSVVDYILHYYSFQHIPVLLF